MNARLAGKLALVTGAGRGIGAATSEALASEGARVLVTDFDFTSASEVAAAINARRGAGSACAARLDVTRFEEWQQVVEHARSSLGGLSVLVNNAGVIVPGSIEDLSLEQWRRGMQVNVESVFLGCQSALPLMREFQPASIVNISSIAGLIAAHNLANYNASKAAVWLLSKSIALHCARQGWDIRCNSVHPAFVRTPILDQLGGGGPVTSQVHEKLARQLPLRRLGEPQDVAAAVVYLASDESRFVTGAELKIDAGVSAM